MRIVNQSDMSTPEVRRLVKAGCYYLDDREVLVVVQSTPRNGQLSGRAYRGWAASARDAQAWVKPLLRGERFVVLLDIGPVRCFPTSNEGDRTCRWKTVEQGDDNKVAHNGDYRHRYNRTEARWEVQRRECVFHPYGGMRSPVIVYASREEALVGLMAHELRHVHQFRHRKPASEVDCERWALKVLERFRAAQERLAS